MPGIAEGNENMNTRAQYRLVRNDGASWTVAEGERLSLGRSRQNTVQIADPTVSRRHATLIVAVGRCWIRDESSARGTFVNGRQVPGQQGICLGDELQIGAAVFRLEQVSVAASVAVKSSVLPQRKQQQVIWAVAGAAIVVVLIAIALVAGGGRGASRVMQNIDTQGDTVTLANGTKLVVPSGAVKGSGKITIEPLEVPKGEFIPSIASPIYRITLQDAELVAPVQISIPLPKGITPEEFEIAVYHYGEKRPALADPHLNVDLPPLWTPLPSMVTDGYVSAWVDSFSLFGPGWFWKGEDASVGIAMDHYYIGGNLKVSVNGSYCFNQSTFHIDQMVDTKVIMYLRMDKSGGVGHFYHAPVMDMTLVSATDSYSLDFRGIAEGETPQRCRPASHTFQVPLEDYIDEKTTSVKLYVMFESKTLWFEYPFRKQFFSPLYTVYIANRASIQLVPPRGRPGDPIGILGEGFKAGDEVKITWGEPEIGPELTTAKVDATGRFTGSALVPKDASPGTSKDIVAVDQSGNLGARASLIVESPNGGPIVRILEPKPPVVSKDKKLEIQIAPPRGKQGEVFEVSVSGLPSKGTSTVELVRPGSMAGEILDEELKADDAGQVRFSISSHSEMATGIYKVYIVTSIGKVEGTFELLAKDPLECLTLTPVGGSAVRNVVLQRSSQEPAVVKFEVQDRCGRVEPAQWMLVNYLPHMITLSLEKGPLLVASIKAGAFEPGIYNAVVGIHYPGHAFPTLTGLQISVTDLKLVYPPSRTTTVAVPRVVGMTPDDAERALKQAGFGVLPGPDGYSNDVPAGYIYDQKPPAGEMFDPKKTIVMIYRSRGKPTPAATAPTPTPTSTPKPLGNLVKVPPVRGMTPDEAEKTLKQAGFGVLPGPDGYSDEVPAGYIYDQKPLPGEMYDPKDTIVIIYRSRGSPTPAPKQRVLPEGFYFLRRGSRSYRYTDPETPNRDFESEVVCREKQSISESVIEMSCTTTYLGNVFPDWKPQAYSQNWNIYTGRHIDTTGIDTYPLGKQTETAVIDILGKRVEARVFKSSEVTPGDDDPRYTNECNYTSYLDVQTSMVFRILSHCEQYFTGDYSGRHYERYKVRYSDRDEVLVDSNLPLAAAK